MAFDHADDVIERIADRCTQVDSGARNIDFILERTVLPRASRALLGHLADETMPERLVLGLDDEGEFTFVFDGADEPEEIEPEEVAPEEAAGPEKMVDPEDG
jgi:type VI secretion system protein VasG